MRAGHRLHLLVERRTIRWRADAGRCVDHRCSPAGRGVPQASRDRHRLAEQSPYLHVHGYRAAGACLAGGADQQCAWPVRTAQPQQRSVPCPVWLGVRGDAGRHRDHAGDVEPAFVAVSDGRRAGLHCHGRAAGVLQQRFGSPAGSDRVPVPDRLRCHAVRRPSAALQRLAGAETGSAGTGADRVDFRRHAEPGQCDWLGPAQQRPVRDATVCDLRLCQPPERNRSARRSVSAFHTDQRGEPTGQCDRLPEQLSPGIGDCTGRHTGGAGRRRLFQLLQSPSKEETHVSKDSPSESSPSESSDDTWKPAKPSLIQLGAIALVALLAVMLVLYIWRFFPFSDDGPYTDNAYVRGYVTTLAPEVSGHLTNVLVKDYETVHEGQLLAQIDPASYAASVEQAVADLDAAKSDLANNAQSQASAVATLSARQAALGTANAELLRAQGDYARSEALVKEGG
ncbi:MAG: HlyD family secretion protein, partial [Proteobacteria bacterium]